MKNKMMPLPVRFNNKIMERCKVIANSEPFICSTASEVARNAMELGLRAMEDNMDGFHYNEETIMQNDELSISN